MVGGNYSERLGIVLQLDCGQYSNIVTESVSKWLVDECECFSEIGRECLCMFKGCVAMIRLRPLNTPERFQHIDRKTVPEMVPISDRSILLRLQTECSFYSWMEIGLFYFGLVFFIAHFPSCSSPLL